MEKGEMENEKTCNNCNGILWNTPVDVSNFKL